MGKIVQGHDIMPFDQGGPPILQRSSAMKLLLIVLALAPVCLAATHKASDADIHRAVIKYPRVTYKGAGGLADANSVLNGHLTKMADLKTSACEAFSASQVQSLARVLYEDSDATLLDVYAEAKDNRRQIFSSADEMNSEFAELLSLTRGRPELSDVLRDGLCHRVVMWFVHHLPKAKQVELAQLGIEMPLLPVADHSSAVVPAEDKAAKAVHKSYSKAITCQKCHVGGIDCLVVPGKGCVAEVPPTTKNELARRCYTTYKELFNVTCGPCDGIAGKYWGDDDDKYFSADPCTVVGTPEQIAPKDRVFAAFPEQFSVDVVAGSDRWGRTTNPSGAAKTPFPPIIDSMYGQITGNWYVDITADSDLWMLRHDTAYHHVSFNGSFIPLLSFHVSEIHSQTSAQQASNNSGPMVSLIDGLPNFLPGGCTCVQDPVGVPDVHHVRTDGLDEDNMQYLGRINLTLSEWDGRTVTVDHWYNWFFHVYMAVDETVAGEHFGKAPERLSSAYAGTACYQNWNLTDPTLAIPDIWYRGIPKSPERVGPSKGKFCLNPGKLDICNNISESTFPPAPEPAPPKKATPWRTIHKSFLPSFDKVQDHLHNLQKQF